MALTMPESVHEEGAQKQSADREDGDDEPARLQVEQSRGEGT
ncbi:hypothetical protein [Leucobacter salsicius]|nr:hypothetical protein [Leucobacter salsicius]